MDYSLTPINKTAAMVSSQPGCASDDTLTNDQMIENLKSKLKNLEARILSSRKGSRERANLGFEKQKLAAEMNKLRGEQKKGDFRNFIMDAMRIELSEFKFNKVMDLAHEMARKSPQQ